MAFPHVCISMWRKRKRLSDRVSYDLCFMGLGFLIILTILIGIVIVASNPKPLYFNPKANLTCFKSQKISFGSMDSFRMK
jgi:hypothetical protein